MLDELLFAEHDVVEQMRVDRRAHLVGSGFHRRDERHRPVRILLGLTEELRGGGEQPLARRDLEVDQPSQRQVDLFDLQQVQLLAETPQRQHLVFGQLHRRRHAQGAPLTPVELHVGARLAQPRHALSLAFTVEAMDATTLIREYLLLGLRFDRIEEGYVDSFTGDPGLRKQVQNEPAPDPADLATGAERLAAEVPLADGLDPARADYLTAHLRALACAGRKFAGQDVGFVDEVAAYFDVHIAKGDPERYRQAHFELDSALGGSGPLYERMQAYRAGEEIPPDRLEETIHAFSSALRDRVRAEYPLPDAESITYEVVTDKPWSGLNYYLGDYRSTVAVNADLKQQMSNLPRLVAFVFYPAENTEHCRKEAGLVEGKGHAEQTIFLVNTPQCLMAEGLADLGL